MLHPLAIAGGLLSALIWAYLLLARGGFWRLTVWHGSLKPDRVLETRATPSSPIAAIIPARNEADVITRSIGSLLNQSFAGRIYIFLVDDASSDATAQIARQAAAANPMALTVIKGSPLPPGWTGKLWAMQQGIDAAAALRPAYFLLTDADILHAPDNLSTLVGMAENGGYDLTSFMVQLRCDTFAEKLLIPAFLFFFFKLYPPAWIADPRHRTAGAAGGCILLRPEALARAGGLAAIRGEIIDDCALAAAVKRSGGTTWLGLTTSASSLRAYGSFREIGRMVARSAFKQLHHSILLLIAAVVGLTLTYLLPVALVFSAHPLLMAIGAPAWAMMTISYLPTVRYYGLHPLWALLLPLAAVFYMGATLVSAMKYWSGRGGEWKGRAQDTGRRAAV